MLHAWLDSQQLLRGQAELCAACRDSSLPGIVRYEDVQRQLRIAQANAIVVQHRPSLGASMWPSSSALLTDLLALGAPVSGSSLPGFQSWLIMLSKADALMTLWVLKDPFSSLASGDLQMLADEELLSSAPGCLIWLHQAFQLRLDLQGACTPSQCHFS